jgi:tRNA threonylcarbamoyl adenosine modification protein (Sua5/YciO/YrdC/YwlC family)
LLPQPTTKTRVIHAGTPEAFDAAACEGAQALRDGLLVGFATETVYGIAAVADNAGAMERLRELKSRPGRPFSVHIGSPGQVERYVKAIPVEARTLISRAWPGPVTVLLPTGGELAEPALQAAGLHDVLTYEGVIGLRCPDEPVAKAMLLAVEQPVVAPSANLAGEPSPRSAQDVLASLDGRIDLLIDSGPTCHGADSTIVQFGPSGAWRILREGAVKSADIRRMIRRTILLVCTGNTCRSPIAAGLVRQALARKLNCRVAELTRHGVEVVSAGLAAAEGLRATPEAAAAARELGADITRHRSQRLTAELIQGADMVWCMTGFHVEEARRLSPESARRIERLSPQEDIPDPVGGGMEAYRAAAAAIETALELRLRRGEL